LDCIGLCSVLRPLQHSIGYMGDGFYRSKDPTNSIKVLKEQIVHIQIKCTISRHEHKTQQGHCCHMGTAIKLSFVIFYIWAL